MGMSLTELEEQLKENEIEILAVTTEDCKRAALLPHLHDDPFDRIIISQAMVRDIPLVTRDQKIWQYDAVEKVW